jgi:hypothetical protein
MIRRMRRVPVLKADRATMHYHSLYMEPQSPINTLLANILTSNIHPNSKHNKVMGNLSLSRDTDHLLLNRDMDNLQLSTVMDSLLLSRVMGSHLLSQGLDSHLHRQVMGSHRVSRATASSLLSKDMGGRPNQAAIHHRRVAMRLLFHQGTRYLFCCLILIAYELAVNTL